ncbi:N-acetyllactosaminide beta-1,3-N-acetylglucosaminyltransferase 3-like [Eucyclogobius newberryi]|uniref:N-acetyllactosaminide beta-1,3-N-acetylglucosaminyltransferase 3-like n=1 Tax=Eucyclogobius newberryi TaxID=166745 RepID=UPI003B5AE2E6
MSKMKGLWKYIPIGALLLFILVCVRINNLNLHKSEMFSNHYYEHFTEEAAIYKRVIRNWPKCEQNTSAANISGFSSLPDHIQNFLYYRHCRHFPMLLDIPDKCGGPEKSSEVFLLLVIKSSPGNYERREVLRKTWAGERQHKGLWIRRIFVSGTSDRGIEKMRLNKLLRAEQNENSDILQWNFEESFFNLTLKQSLFLEWMERNCPNARFLFNGDDDVFANTDGMVEYLQDLPGNDGSGHLYTGFVFKDTGPVRYKKSKYYIPEQIQESNTYIPYCGGGGYLLSGHTAMVIYNMSQSIVVHPIDDVYIGMCVRKAGLLPMFHMGVRTLGLANEAVRNIDEQDPCYMKGLLLLHRFLPAQMYLMWEKINDPHLKCGVQFWTDV